MKPCEEGKCAFNPQLCNKPFAVCYDKYEEGDCEWEPVQITLYRNPHTGRLQDMKGFAGHCPTCRKKVR